MYMLQVGTLRSLLNELAHLRVVTIVKRASLFNRDLMVGRSQPLNFNSEEYYPIIHQDFL